MEKFVPSLLNLDLKILEELTFIKSFAKAEINVMTVEAMKGGYQDLTACPVSQ